MCGISIEVDIAKAGKKGDGWGVIVLHKTVEKPNLGPKCTPHTLYTRTVKCAHEGNLEELMSGITHH